MRLTTTKIQVNKEEEYDRRGLTKDESIFLSDTTTGDYVLIALDLREEGAEKRPKLMVVNLRTRASIRFYMDKYMKVLGPLGIL